MILRIAELAVVGMWFLSALLVGIRIVVCIHIDDREDDPLTPPNYDDPYHDFRLVA